MVHGSRQIAALCVVVALALSCGRTPTKQSTKRNIPVELHDGDIAFRRGSGVASGAVLMSNREGSFSHVGLVVHTDSAWCVVHEVPFEGKCPEDDKIYCEEVGEFFSDVKSATGAVYRLSGLDSAQRHTIIEYALGHLARQTPFDHEYNLEDDSRQYCSEFVWRCYLELGVDLTRGERTRVAVPGFAGLHIMPADIESNPDLELVYQF